MITDAKEMFVPLGSPLSLIAAVGVDTLSPLVVDLMGGGVGTPITNHYGTSAQPGQADGKGVGQFRPELVVTIGTGLVADTGTPILQCELQAAPDAGGGTPGTWQVIGMGPLISVAQGIAGRQIMRLPYLPPFPDNLRPRFLRLNFAVSAGANYSAGTIGSALVTTARDDPFQMQAAKAYSLGPMS